jgi:ABC-type proline/glycine betaine transport system permease subunit
MNLKKEFNIYFHSINWKNLILFAIILFFIQNIDGWVELWRMIALVGFIVLITIYIYLKNKIDATKKKKNKK